MRNEFEHRNLWLQLLLGMRSLGVRLDALLDRHAPERPGPAADAPDAVTPAGDEEPVAFVLGLVAVRARLDAVLAAAARDPSAPTDAAPPGPAPDVRGVLR